MISTTGGRIRIVAIDSKTPNDYIEMQFFPKDVKRSRSAGMEGAKIIGRNLPQYDYTSGESNLTLDFDFVSEETDRRDAFRKLVWLESMTYSEGLLEPPQRVMIVFGDWLRGNVYHIKSVNSTATLFHKQYGLYPQQITAEVQFGLEETIGVPIMASDIRNLSEPIGAQDESLELNSSRSAELENVQRNKEGIVSPAFGSDLESIRQNRTFELRRNRLSRGLGLAEDIVEWTKLGFAIAK